MVRRTRAFCFATAALAFVAMACAGPNAVKPAGETAKEDQEDNVAAPRKPPPAPAAPPAKKPEPETAAEPAPPAKVEPPVKPARPGARAYASEASPKDGKGLRRDSLRAGIL